MPEPAPLDYERVTTRPRRDMRLVWILVGTLALLFIVMLPSFSSRPERAYRARCANNLRQVGQAIAMYCSDNQQQYPSDVGLLVLTAGWSTEVFVCPQSGDTALKASAAQQAATLLSGGHCSYVYVGAGMMPFGRANDVVAFEFPDNHGRRAGGNVLYGDAHVQWESFDTLAQLVGELEAGRNPPVIGALTAKQAKAMYEQKWVPKLASIKDGTWAASLPRPSTRPSPEAK